MIKQQIRENPLKIFIQYQWLICSHNWLQKLRMVDVYTYYNITKFLNISSVINTIKGNWYTLPGFDELSMYI